MVLLLKKELERQKQKRKNPHLWSWLPCKWKKNREGECKICDMEKYTFLSLKHSLRDQIRKRTQPGKEATSCSSIEPSVGVLRVTGVLGLLRSHEEGDGPDFVIQEAVSMQQNGAGAV